MGTGELGLGVALGAVTAELLPIVGLTLPPARGVLWGGAGVGDGGELAGEGGGLGLEGGGGEDEDAAQYTCGQCDKSPSSTVAADTRKAAAAWYNTSRMSVLTRTRHSCGGRGGGW